MTRFTLRQDAIDRLADEASGRFVLHANASGNRREIDRRNRQG
jgi:hypothetical protein